MYVCVCVHIYMIHGNGISIRVIELHEVVIVGANEVLPWLQLLYIGSLANGQLEVSGVSNPWSTLTAQQQCCTAVPLGFTTSSTTVVGSMAAQTLALRLCLLFG